MNNHISSSTSAAVRQQHSVERGNQSNPASHFGQQFNFSGGGNSLNLLLSLIIQLVQLLLAELLNQDNGDEYRSTDGSGNNKACPERGAAEQPVNKLTSPDATREPGGSTEVNLPSPRAISNVVSDQQGDTENHKGLSDMFWVWGQFLDHDITLIEGHDPDARADIAVPAGDPYFDPAGTGTATIGFTRSDSVIDASGQKTQINDITAFIDGSNVYGSDQETADNLRSFEGGRMKVDENNLLPKDDSGQYQAGDIRANENVALTSMHTIWVREHNQIADSLSAGNPEWSDEKVYQEARQQVVAEMQAITYNEFLPNLLGDDALGQYQGYNPDQDPQMNSEFSSAAYRFGHSMLSPNLLRLDEDGNEIPEGNLALKDAFFQPEKVAEGGVDSILRGAASQTAQAVDTQVVDDVRNFLFGPPGAGGLDLVSLNIQRGRDHALPGYNDAREELGLSRIESFDDPIWQEGVGEKLAQVYDSPDDVDLWVAGLAENHVGDSLMGETATNIMTTQFQSLRDGDRFWYENQYSGQDLQQLNNLSLSDIIKRNTDIVNVQDDVMVASNAHQNVADEPAQMMRMQRSVAVPQASPQAQSIAPEVPDNNVIEELQNAIQRGYLG
ncbi:MAG: Peroxinectin (EC [uncultured Thiotrichaceae bacterium]|uniref:Peroxinectin (EC) n=1 Tax=uncultured Thiotrichaceae bacterium TaxID=298394 RepID=A0A6S6TR88_9GAMM|nr:MAG: Peroxinectin (EC [uncultured Thiotrichaceae bacterium]